MRTKRESGIANRESRETLPFRLDFRFAILDS
jgi:hypothetical protein